jgi:hypothetical protein
MEQIYIDALTERAKQDETILAQLPEDVRCRVEEKLSTEIQVGEEIDGTEDIN